MNAADLCNDGTALGQAGRTEAAAEKFRAAIALDPGLPEAHANLAFALGQLGQVEAAVASARRAVALRPDFLLALLTLAKLLWQANDLPAASDVCRQAAALAPDDPVVRHALGIALRQEGDLAGAAEASRRAIAALPDFPDPHFNLAMALLAGGELAEGFAEYEWRWGTEPFRPFARDFPQPRWRGEPAAGRRLLLHGEQGFGDMLQFCRYATLASARGFSVLLEVPPQLVRLLRTLPGQVTVIAAGEPLPAFDLHCPLLSAPLAFGTTLDNIPAATCYLRADPAPWLSRLPPGRRVGFAWAGNPRAHMPGAAAIDRRRSIDPARLAPLARVPGVVPVSLQKGGPPAPFPLFDAMGEMADFADTAALVAALDLVISVDSAVAHLAAALGRPVWLLDRFDHCWRWLAGRADSPWYPTLRIFRQPRAGDWDTVIEQVAAALRG